MATIENITDIAQLVEVFKAMTDNELVATDLVQRGAEDALVKLQGFGVSSETVAEMLISLRAGRDRLRSVATTRAINLVSEE